MNKPRRQLNRFLSRLIQRLSLPKNRGSFSGPFRGSFFVANCGPSLIDQGTLAGAVFALTVDFGENFFDAFRCEHLSYDEGEFYNLRLARQQTVTWRSDIYPILTGCNAVLRAA